MTRERPSLFFWLGVGLAGLVVVLLSFWAAGFEWFSRDDFRFLAYVQLTDQWSWRKVFLPFDERFWLFYRPLSMETFFWVGYRLFGLDASGFFRLSLALHFASGGLVYRVARQLKMAPQVAAATALLAVSRPGSLGEIYYGSVFMYVGQVGFGLVCISAFLDQLRGAGWWARPLSCLGLALALLCNEAAVATPVLMGWAALAAGEIGSPRAAARVLRAAVPQLLLLLLYLVFRFRWIAAVDAPALYTLSVGPHVAGNALRLLELIFGGGARLTLAAGLAAAFFAAGAVRGAELRRYLLRAGLACAGWLATSAAPFALLPYPQGRWAMPLAAPAALLLGVGLEGLWRGWASAGRARALEAALVAGLLLTLPYATLRGVAAHPVGPHPRRVIEWIAAQDPPLPQRAVLVLLYGAPGLASSEQGDRFRYLTYGGGVLNAVDPHTQRVMRFQDLSRRPARNALRADSVYLELLPDFDIRRADPQRLDRELRRRF